MAENTATAKVYLFAYDISVSGSDKKVTDEVRSEASTTVMNVLKLCESTKKLLDTTWLIQGDKIHSTLEHKFAFLEIPENVEVEIKYILVDISGCQQEDVKVETLNSKDFKHLRTIPLAEFRNLK